MSQANFDINQRFGFLNDLTTMVVNGITPSLIVVGEGGLGKTHSVTQTICENGFEEADYVFFKGYSTARGLYNTLYDNNGKLIVFDDCDSVLDDKVAVNILKSALDSYEKRTISWMAKMNKSDEYPQHFNFTGRIIFISNKSKEKIDEAVLTRSLTVDLTMTPDDKVARMESILESILPEYDIDVKQDALDFLKSVKEEVSLNMRMLIMISKMRRMYPDTWRSLASYMVKS
jgi:chromosomal replication initiation ATPase DnaA